MGIDRLKHPLVSVIVPTFNRLDSLPITLGSICNQTFKDFEIIVVNDAGKSVQAVINEYSKKATIVCIEHFQNKGLAAARNTAIRSSRGKYIAYLDDDDIFYPDHLETLVPVLENSDCQVAYTDAHRSWKQMRGGKLVEISKDMPYSCDFDYDRILIRNFIPVLCVMHGKDCLDRVGLFDETLSRHEDWDLWIRLSFHYEFHHVKKTTCEFATRTDGTSMRSSNILPFWETTCRIYKKHAKLTCAKPSICEGQLLALIDIVMGQERLIGDLQSFKDKVRRLLMYKLYVLGKKLIGLLSSKARKNF